MTGPLAERHLVAGVDHAAFPTFDPVGTVTFYRDVLGFRAVAELPGGAFLQAPDSTNDHDIAFFSIGETAGDSTAGRSSVGLYHLAWEVGTLGDLLEVGQALQGAGALVGASDHGTTKSLYAKDPDGLEFEVCWVVPAEHLDPEVAMTTRPLDLQAELERYGADTVGGR